MKNTATKTLPKASPEKISQEQPYTGDNVIELIHEDHRKVKEMFFQYEQLEDKSEKEQLAKTIIKELYVHATVEEQVVYPAVRKEAEDADCLIDEADTEHHVAKLLMTELSSMK